MDNDRPADTSRVVLRPATPSDRDAVQRLLITCGWNQHPRITDPARFAKLYDAADRSFVADDGGAIVGYLRALTDGVSNGYIGLMAVAPTHRRRGIGRQLVERLLGDDDGITWVLRAGRDGAAEFWSAVGFVRSEIAMERVRRR
jgi:ribosomal protein S18 acetylase RimI-like enzyme